MKNSIQCFGVLVAFTFWTTGAWSGAYEDWRDATELVKKQDYKTAIPLYDRAIASKAYSGIYLAQLYHMRGRAKLLSHGIRLTNDEALLRSAETDAQQSREQLNTLLGAWGEDTGWEIDGRMPDIPAEPLQVNGVERVALARSIDLSHGRQRIIVAGQQLGYNRASALVPDVDVGASAEKEGGESWKVGPAITVPIPLFDQGQARIARAAVELRRAQQEYYALGVRIRSTARAVRDRIAGARDRALYYRDILLPLRERIVTEGQLHYNAMQIGIFQLLRDREQQIETGVAYVEALRDYWLARADLAQIASGRLPTPTGSRLGGSGRQMKLKETEGH